MTDDNRWHAVVIGREGSSQREGRAQHREEAAGHHGAAQGFGPGLSRKRGPVEAEERQAVERSRPRLPVLEFRKREVHRCAAPRLPAGIQLNETVRVPERQRPQQHAVDDGEERRVCADPERQRHNRRDGEGWRSRERAHRAMKTGDEGNVHPRMLGPGTIPGSSPDCIIRLAVRSLDRCASRGAPGHNTRAPRRAAARRGRDPTWRGRPREWRTVGWTSAARPRPKQPGQ